MGFIGVVIPVHDEEDRLAPCLHSVCASAARSAAAGTVVEIFVVLDSCTDRSAEIAAGFPVQVLAISAGSAGVARQTGARAALRAGATWLAFTDGDTTVAPDWLAAQQAEATHVVCGAVSISDWHLHPDEVRNAYERHYRFRDGHGHIHGANLGVSAVAYLAAGGFDPVGLEEDVRLVRRLIDLGFSIRWSISPRVYTSARLENRVPGGFGGFIRSLIARHPATERGQPEASRVSG